MTTHEHSYLGQKLRHSHPGGDQEHGYYEYPDDGFPYPATVVPAYKPGDNLRWQQEHQGTLFPQSGTPLADALADALALVDKAQGNDIESGRRLVSLSFTDVATARELAALRELAEAVRVHLLSRATALAGRYVAYAMKFINDPTAGEPTDEELERVLSGCVRAPKSEEYPKIRAEVEAWRQYGLTTAELAELEDATAVWTVTRGDLQRIAGRALTDEETRTALAAISGGDVMDVVASAVTTVLPDGRYL